MWRFLILSLILLGCDTPSGLPEAQKGTSIGLEFEPIDVPAIVFESDAPKVKPTITIYSPDSFYCSWCEKWKSQKQPGFERSGWTVKQETAPDSTGPFPWFQVLDGDGKEYTIQEYLTSERLNAARNSRN